MHINEHKARTRKLLGKDWRFLHAWLDRYFDQYLSWHRILLHHQAGVELAVAEFGEEARTAAIIHIQDDWSGELPTGPLAVSRYYTKLPIRSMAEGLVEELRKLYGQDFGLAEIWPS